MASAARQAGKNLIFHSNHRVQYACGDLTEKLDDYKITQRMNRKGNCWDNAPAENFFKTLRHELDMPVYFQSYQQAEENLKQKSAA